MISTVIGKRGKLSRNIRVMDVYRVVSHFG